jgi:hypothetical protein
MLIQKTYKKTPKYLYITMPKQKNAKPHFEKKKLSDGNPNPKYVDLLDEDTPIAGQKFFCASFVSPEKIIMKRELYLFQQFVKQWDLSKSLAKYNDFLNFMAYKYNLKIEGLMQNFQEFVKEEKKKLNDSAVEDDFYIFIDKNEDELNAKFNREHAFQTSVRGLKIRGVFSTQEEAEKHCKKIREGDPNHDIFVGPVGIWVPWDPDAYKTGDVQYMEEELNELYHKKIENQEKAKQHMQERIKAEKMEAIRRNVEIAKKTGQKLTQTIDEDGNLIGGPSHANYDNVDVSTLNIGNELKELLDKENEEKNGGGNNGEPGDVV